MAEHQRLDRLDRHDRGRPRLAVERGLLPDERTRPAEGEHDLAAGGGQRRHLRAA
jgi:hypothetical protein